MNRTVHMVLVFIIYFIIHLPLGDEQNCAHGTCFHCILNHTSPNGRRTELCFLYHTLPLGDKENCTWVLFSLYPLSYTSRWRWTELCTWDLFSLCSLSYTSRWQMNRTVHMGLVFIIFYIIHLPLGDGQNCAHGTCFYYFLYHTPPAGRWIEIFTWDLFLLFSLLNTSAGRWQELCCRVLLRVLLYITIFCITLLPAGDDETCPRFGCFASFITITSAGRWTNVCEWVKVLLFFFATLPHAEIISNKHSLILFERATYIRVISYLFIY